MSTIKVDTIATRTGSGNITASNTIAGTSATLSGTLGVTGVSTLTGNVGIGNGTPSQLLSVGGSSSGVKVIQVTNSTAGTAFNKGMQMFINDTAGGLNLRENYPLQVYVNGAERARFLPSGGLTFNGDTADANALDDYEEGTWTPDFQSTSASFSYSVQGGDYTKIGRLVFANFRIQLSGAPSGTTSNVVFVGGLPFVIGSLNGTYHGGHPGHYFNFNLNTGAAKHGTLAYQLPQGSHRVELKVVGDNLGETAVLASHLNSAAQIRGQILYHTT